MASRGTSDSAVIPLTIVGVVLIPAVAVWSSLALAHRLSGTPQPQGNPVRVLIETASGQSPWPSEATQWLIGEGIGALIVAAVVGWLWLRPSHRAKRVIDVASTHLPVDRDGLKRYLGEHTAPGLFVGPGVEFGNLLRRGKPTKQQVQMSWEDVGVIFGGTRMGKTQSQVVPAIIAAPGACIVTSNKSDVYTTTSAVRARSGSVWLFDPQQIANLDAPTWWWNPLAGVRDLIDAERLANIWVDVSKPKNASESSYFDPRARALLSALVMAAAVASKPLTAVGEWLKDPADTEPARVLQGAYDAVSTTIDACRALPDKQRTGVYDTALTYVSWLDNPLIARWVVGDHTNRRQFDPSEFVRSTETVFLLSREGVGSAAPLVTAFTATILREAERFAEQSGGRLPKPLLAVLDEAANVCRWKELPDLYSHYGSRSIVCLTVLQSWAQGTEVWGQEGMEKMWGAANALVILGGIKDTRFLQRISALCGEWDAPHKSVSGTPTGGNRSHTVTTRRESILSVGLLGALPAGRAVVLLSGTMPVVVETVPWTKRHIAGEIKAAQEPHREEVAA